MLFVCFQFYKEAEDLCRQTYGDYHPLMGRILRNTGIAHEDKRDYRKSYQYFKRVSEITMEVYGAHHPKVLKANAVLAEPTYQRIAAMIEQER